MKRILTFLPSSGMRGGTAPAAVVHGTAGATWGVTAEAGVIVQSFRRNVTRDKKVIKDEVGNIAVSSRYNPTAKYSISAYKKATDGGDIGIQAPGDTLTLAGTTTGNGVSAGLVLMDSINTQQANEDFLKVDIEAEQAPLLLAAY
jgi:hypothetical protein